MIGLKLFEILYNTLHFRQEMKKNIPAKNYQKLSTSINSHHIKSL